MTEYDYSPEAYEKYMQTRNRVSNWVTEQSRHHAEYKNPFVPRAPSSVPSRQSSTRTSHRSNPHSPSSSSPPRPRPEPHRSFTTPVEVHRTSKSPTRSHVSTSPTYYAPTSHVAYLPPAPAGYQTAYQTYTYDPSSREIVLPPPRPGEKYVIIPPKGRRVEVVTDPSTTARSSSRSSRSSSSKKDHQPLLKRLLTNLGPPSKGSSRRSSSTTRERSRTY